MTLKFIARLHSASNKFKRIRNAKIICHTNPPKELRVEKTQHAIDTLFWFDDTSAIDVTKVVGIRYSTFLSSYDCENNVPRDHSIRFHYILLALSVSASMNEHLSFAVPDKETAEKLINDFKEKQKAVLLEMKCLPSSSSIGDYINIFKELKKW